MRGLLGLVWALGGAVAGFVVFAAAALLFAKLSSMTDREGAVGYFVLGLGLLGAVLGLIAGLVWYARQAPPGQAGASALSGVLGVVGLVAVLAACVWAFLSLREAPLEYDGAMATLELELRVRTSEVPPNAESGWFTVEVQTASTRPEGIPLWDRARTEGDVTIIPVVQQPLYRSGSRSIVVAVRDRQTEVFVPRMTRRPDPRADWSDWETPPTVEPPYGVVPTAPLQPMFALRYRVRRYGE
jgi:hypothetical protein